MFPKMSGKAKCALLVLTLLLVLVLVVAWSHIVFLGTVTPKSTKGKVFFDIDYGTTNGLRKLVVSDACSGDILWHIGLNSYKGDTLQYGEIPTEFTIFNGLTRSAGQIVPKPPVVPPKLLDGRFYKVTAYWQYDVMITAATGDTVSYFMKKGDKITLFTRMTPPAN